MKSERNFDQFVDIALLFFSAWTQPHKFLRTQLDGIFFVLVYPWVLGPWQVGHLFLRNSFSLFKALLFSFVSLPFAFYLYFFSQLILILSQVILRLIGLVQPLEWSLGGALGGVSTLKAPLEIFLSTCSPAGVWKEWMNAQPQVFIPLPSPLGGLLVQFSPSTVLHEV